MSNELKVAVVPIDPESIERNPDKGMVKKRVATGIRITVTLNQPISDPRFHQLSVKNRRTSSLNHSAPPAFEFAYAITEDAIWVARSLGGKLDFSETYADVESFGPPLYYKFKYQAEIPCPHCGQLHTRMEYLSNKDLLSQIYGECPACRELIKLRWQSVEDCIESILPYNYEYKVQVSIDLSNCARDSTVNPSESGLSLSDWSGMDIEERQEWLYAETREWGLQHIDYSWEGPS
jgi:hypothetical protein